MGWDICTFALLLASLTLRRWQGCKSFTFTFLLYQHNIFEYYLFAFERDCWQYRFQPWHFCHGIIHIVINYLLVIYFN